MVLTWCQSQNSKVAWHSHDITAVFENKCSCSLQGADGEREGPVWITSEVLVAQLCPTLWDFMDCSLSGSSVRGFSRQAYWSGLPCPGPGIQPGSPALQVPYSLSHQGKPVLIIRDYDHSADWKWRHIAIAFQTSKACLAWLPWALSFLQNSHRWQAPLLFAVEQRRPPLREWQHFAKCLSLRSWGTVSVDYMVIYFFLISGY